MTKQLNEQAIQNELNESAFFNKVESATPELHNHDAPSTSPLNHETMPPFNHDTLIPRHHDLFLEDIRKALKSFGKEAATYRFTPKEKSDLAGLIYEFKQKGIRTSENEISRIAINFIINDQKEFGEESILDIVLNLLNS